MQEIYKNIKRYRELNGWTQKELANRAGYTSHSAIAKIEAGRVDLPASQIMKFVEVFGITSDDLLGPSVSLDSQISEEERMILRAYRQLDESGKDLICAALQVKRAEALKLSDSQVG